jgi:hypothetical protein
MDELLVVAIEVEKVVGKIGEAPFEPLKDEKDEKAMKGLIQHSNTFTFTMKCWEIYLKDSMARKSFHIEIEEVQMCVNYAIWYVGHIGVFAC